MKERKKLMGEDTELSSSQKQRNHPLSTVSVAIQLQSSHPTAKVLLHRAILRPRLQCPSSHLLLLLPRLYRYNSNIHSITPHTITRASLTTMPLPPTPLTCSQQAYHSKVLAVVSLRVFLRVFLKEVEDCRQVSSYLKDCRPVIKLMNSTILLLQEEATWAQLCTRLLPPCREVGSTWVAAEAGVGVCRDSTLIISPHLTAHNSMSNSPLKPRPMSRPLVHSSSHRSTNQWAILCHMIEPECTCSHSYRRT